MRCRKLAGDAAPMTHPSPGALRWWQRGGRMAVTTYEIGVAGRVPAELVPALGEVRIREQQLRTVLTGRFVDQAELHGFLGRLRALGLDLVEVRSVPVPDNEPQRHDDGGT